VNTTSARRYIREGDRLTRRQFKASAAQFTADWNECLEVIERRLLATHPRTDCLEPAVYHAIVRAELNTWFQPEHHRGAWLRALSNVRPEVAATLRQGLTDIRLPQRSYRLAPPRWAGPLVYAATVAAPFLWFRTSSLPVMYQLVGSVAVSLLLLAIGVAAWRWERRRRRRQAVAAIRECLDVEGARLPAILEEMQ